jgi:hypothetical protein
MAGQNSDFGFHAWFPRAVLMPVLQCLAGALATQLLEACR